MNYYEKLKEDLGVNRYNHSIRVRDTAIDLAKRFGCNVNKAIMAGLLHDCGKYYNKDYLLKQAFEFGIMNDESLINNKHIIHAALGAEIAQKEYGVEDVEILDAIRYHTTGREGMTLLDKIVYLADYIEPERDFYGVDEVRELTKTNIDLAMIKALEDSISYLLNTQKIIHLDTLRARNYLIQFGGK